MSQKGLHRNVTPLLHFFRTILRGKDHVNPLRFADEQAARTQPPPTVPGGPYHKSTKIYYYTRDARREVAPPLVVSSSAGQIGSGEKEAAKPKIVTPNAVYLTK